MKRIFQAAAALLLAATPALAQMQVNNPPTIGSIGAAPSTFTQDGAGAVSINTIALIKKAVNFAEWGPACDGVTNDQAKFAQAGAQAIATTGVLYIPSCNTAPTASTYKMAGLTTFTAPDTTHSQLLIVIDRAVQITFNSTTGWVTFSGAGAGGGMNKDTGVTGGSIFPYSGQVTGTGYAITFNNVARGIVQNMSFNYTPQTNIGANGVLITGGAITTDISHNYFDIATGGYCVRVTGTASNFNRIQHNECVHSATAGISIASANIANLVERNYLETNTGDGIDDAGTATQVNSNFLDNNTGAYDLNLTGNGTIATNNIISPSAAATAPVRLNGGGQTLTNTQFPGTASPHGANVLLDTASSNVFVAGIQSATAPTGGNYFTNSGTNNNVCNVFNASGAAVASPCTISTTGTMTITNSGATALLVTGGGTNKALRFEGNAGSAEIDAVDVTGVASFQPLLLNGSTMGLQASQVTKLDYGNTVGGTWTASDPWNFLHASIKMSGITTGTNADTVCLKADGTLLIQAAACTISSMRFKNLIGGYKAGGALDTVAKLEPIVFTMKPGEKPNPDRNYERPQIGLSAENVAAIEPRCAIYEDDGVTPKSYRQECLIAVLVAGMQAQQREIAALKAR